MKPHLFIRTAACFAVLALLLAPASVSAAADRDLSRAAIGKLGKAATALVELPGHLGYASAFCIHPSGLFITNAHAVPPSVPPFQGLRINLVLNSGLKTQKVLKAKVVRHDQKLDLAMLRVERRPRAKKLPALTFGSDEHLEELMELVAFGYPFGAALATGPGQYPAISINEGSVTSLRRKDGELFLIQLDAALNPGNSGGPVLDRKGKVIGVVVAGVFGAGVNLAIPVSHVSRFVSKPDIQFTPPVIKRANRHEAVEFRARAVSLLPSAAPLTLQLTLSTGKGKERSFKMRLTDGAYRVKAVPIPRPKGPVVLRLKVKYADGSASGPVIDRSFKIGAKTVKFSEIRRLQFGPKPQAILYDGETLEGDVSGLAAVPFKIGGQLQPLNLASAVEVNVDFPGRINSVACTIVALKAGKEVGRLNHKISPEGDSNSQ